MARRVEHADIEIERLADPVRERRVVGDIVVGQRMNQARSPVVSIARETSVPPAAEK